MKEEDDRRQKSDLQRRQAETVFAEDKTAGEDVTLEIRMYFRSGSSERVFAALTS